MFSYRHGFHAGNHADVLKHTVLVQLLAYLTGKPKPLAFVDTHAGAGWYALDSTFAAKMSEFRDGIGRLWAPKNQLPPALAAYLEQVVRVNPSGELRRYPGSPQIALQMLRGHDRLQLFELHSTESEVLRRQYAGTKGRVTVRAEDGFDGLKAVLPPPSRRGLVLLDPSYEDKADYRRVLDAMREALRRFATGVYAVWYPQVQRPEARELPAALKKLAPGDWLHVSLTVKAPAADGLGLHGSGVMVFNPPWNLEAILKPALPALVELLRQDSHASYSLDFRQT